MQFLNDDLEMRNPLWPYVKKELKRGIELRLDNMKELSLTLLMEGKKITLDSLVFRSYVCVVGLKSLRG